MDASNSLCCLDTANRTNRVAEGNYEICKSDSRPIMATKRSARIAKRRSMHQLHYAQSAITNYFQVRSVSTVTNRIKHGQSDGIDTTDDSDPSHIIQNDDDNTYEYARSFEQHFQPLICGSFTMNKKQNVTSDQVVNQSICHSTFGLYLPNEVVVQPTDGAVADGDADDDDSGSNSSDEPNIFLRKPVLHLDIDTSLYQPSSILIKKRSEIGPNSASVLKTATLSKITDKRAVDIARPGVDNVFRKTNEKKAGKHKTKRKIKYRSGGNSFGDALHSSDSNSCDSGVVTDRTPDAVSALGKPTTPHRIVCRSSTRSQAKTSGQLYTQKTITNFTNINFTCMPQIENDSLSPILTDDYKSKIR